MIPVVLKDKYMATAFVLSLVLLVSAFFIAYVNFWDAGNILVIHSSPFKGADFFGVKNDVFGIIIASAIVWLMNMALAQEFYYKERFLSYLLAFSTLFFTVLILVTIDGIISLN